MSVFAAGAPQISAMEPRARKSQFRARKRGRPFRFVSPQGLGAKRRDASPSCVSRYKAARRGKLVQGRHRAMRAILADRCFCAPRSAVGEAQAEPSAETIARGKALTEAADCASCHTADPAKPFAGGKRIDTPFGGIYSPNLTPDRETGLGGWSDDDFSARCATAWRPTARAITRRSPIRISRN